MNLREHEWDEAKHPRAQAGGASGGEFVSAGETAARAFESSVSGKSTEYAQAFDRHGNPLLAQREGKTSGKDKAVFFTSDDIVRMVHKDALFSHNHPAGTSLSKEDMDLALLLNVKEMRAVAGAKVFIARRSGEKWGFGGGTVYDAYNKHANALKGAYTDRASLTDAVMRAVAKELRFDYVVKERAN